MKNKNEDFMESQKHLYEKYGFLNSRVKIIPFIIGDDGPNLILFYRHTNNHKGYEFINEGVESYDIKIPNYIQENKIAGIASIEDISKIIASQKTDSKKPRNYQQHIDEQIKKGTRLNASFRGIKEEFLANLPLYNNINIGELIMQYDISLPAFQNNQSDGKTYTIYTTFVIANQRYLVDKDGNFDSTLKLKENDEHETLHLFSLEETVDKLKNESFKSSNDDFNALSFAFDLRTPDNLLKVLYKDNTSNFHRFAGKYKIF